MSQNVRLTFIDTQNIYGTMNTGTVRISNLTDSDKKMIMAIHDMYTLEELGNYTLTPDDKRLIFQTHRKRVGEDYGFDWHKMFMADQEKLDGSVFEITRDYVEAHPNGWSDIPEDMLMIKSDVPGVAVGLPVADCPVVFVTDAKRGITVAAHCGGQMIDAQIPRKAVEQMLHVGCRPEDLHVFVGAKAGPNWTYVGNPPAWATDASVWEGAITHHTRNTDDGLVDVFPIDLQTALDRQFVSAGVSPEHIAYDPHDTITDPNYYSNSESRNNPDKFGRQFVGVFIPEEGKQNSGHGRSR